LGLAQPYAWECMTANNTLLCIHRDPAQLSMLQEYGYEVLTAASARLGLQLAEVCPVAAVIVDYHMPEMNGHEVATKIKRIRPQVPIVMVSSDDAVPKQVLDAIDAFVSKDEVARCLLSVLSRVCREGPSSFPVSDRSVA